MRNTVVPSLLELSGAAGTRIVAVPGLGLSVDISRRTLTRLQPDIGSVLVALPGFGLPASSAMALDPRALAARLVDELVGLDRSPVVLFGHSASCQIVVEAAVLAPERVSGLILVGPTTDPSASSWPRLAGRWLRSAAWEHPHQVPLLIRDYRHTGPAAMLRAMNAARSAHVERTLAATKCPVLVVRGPQDRIAPRAWTATLAGLTPEGRAITLRAGAHMVPITHPELLAPVIREFVGSN